MLQLSTGLPVTLLSDTSEGNCKSPRRFSCVLVDFVAPLCRLFNISFVLNVIFGDEDFLANDLDRFLAETLAIATSGRRTKGASFCFLLIRKPFSLAPISAPCLRFEPLLSAIEGRKDCSLSPVEEYKTILRGDENPVNVSEVQVSAEKEEDFDAMHLGLLKPVIATLTLYIMRRSAPIKLNKTSLFSP